MATLAVLVDYDNLDRAMTAAGPISCAKRILQAVPTVVLLKFDTLAVRLYGGWRSNGRLTQAAQRIVPEIRASSPGIFSVPDGQSHAAKRLIVELAESPIGLTVPLNETLARDRSLRRFRANTSRLAACVNIPGCGMKTHFSLTEKSPCLDRACPMELGDLLVRDEQKMVDTLIVADIAQQTFVAGASDIVVVSSDTDMWPGVLLALQNSCNVIHVHTRGGRTQPHLLQTLVRQMTGAYSEANV